MQILKLTDKVVFTADCQLKRRTWANRTNITDDPIAGYRQVIDHAIAHNADVVIAGDFFDTQWPDTHTMRQVDTENNRLRAKGRNVYGIVGNHDMSTGLLETGDPETSWYAFVGIIPLNKRIVHFAGVNWYALDWIRNPKEEVAKTPANCTGLIIHQLFEGIVPTFIAHNITPADVPQHVQRVLVGDFHQRLVRKLDHLEIHSPGSTYLCKIDEDPVKACTLISPGPLGPVYGDLALKTRQVVRCTVLTDGDLQSTIDLLRQVDDNPDCPPGCETSILHVKFSPLLKEVESRIKAACPPNVYPMLEKLVLDEDGKPVDANTADDGQAFSYDPSDILPGVMSAADDQAAFDFTLGLLTTANPMEFIRQQRAKFGAEKQ